MYARIRLTKNISNSIGYNEEKIKRGAAECFLAGNYLKDLNRMTREDKLERFENRTSLNERTKNNSLRISLNFDSTENISNEQMKMLVSRYMTGIGFEREPYLAYRHYDTGHPHVHVVSTNIHSDGSKTLIGVPFIYKSREITRQLENEYGLCQSRKIRIEEAEKFEVRQAQKVIHGEMSLTRSISNVLNTVVDHYKYASMNELNAVLHLYNVGANRGREDSRLFQHRGLMYHALDERGKFTGIGVKASALLLKPTLDNLEKKFALNETLKEGYRERLTTAIDWTLTGQPPIWKEFKESLERDGISVVVQQNKYIKDGEHIYFIDHQSRVVFSGEDLGGQYNLQTIRQRCAEEATQEQEQTLIHRLHLTL